MNLLDGVKCLGIEVPIFIAGSSGAIVFLTKTTKMTKTQQFLTILAGGLSANYLTPLVGDWLGLEIKVLYGLAFLLGYSGMKSVELILGVIFKKIQK
jgi:hypothetical protein